MVGEEGAEGEGRGRGYEGQVYLEVFLPGFVYHKESHAGRLLLAVSNQNTYSPAVCRSPQWSRQGRQTTLTHW